MNKSNIFLTAVMALTINSSFASCYNNYQERRIEAEEIINNSNYQQTQREGAAVFTSINMVVLAALSANPAGSALPSTIGGAGMLSAAFIAKKYIDLRVDDDATDAIRKKALLEASLNILKEARIGQGPHLSQALVAINQNVSTSISMKDLADTILGQDNSELYCQGERIMSPTGIISLAIEELKQGL